MAGLCRAGELIRTGTANPERIARLYSTAFPGANYADMQKAGMLDYLTTEGPQPVRYTAAVMLWDDPLQGIAMTNYTKLDPDAYARIEPHYEALARELETLRDAEGPADLAHVATLARALHCKIKLRLRLLNAYEAKDRVALAEVRDAVPEVIAAFEELTTSFRRMWLRNYKPFGLEVIQIRQGGMIERLRETARRLDEYLDGRIHSIEELEEHLDSDQDCGWGGYAYWASSTTVF